MRHHDWRNEALHSEFNKEIDSPSIIVAMISTLTLVALIAFTIFIAKHLITFMDTYADVL